MSIYLDWKLMKINYNAIFKRPLKNITCFKNSHKIKPLVVYTVSNCQKEQWAATNYIRVPNLIATGHHMESLTDGKTNVKAFITKETI